MVATRLAAWPIYLSTSKCNGTRAGERYVVHCIFCDLFWCWAARCKCPETICCQQKTPRQYGHGIKCLQSAQHADSFVGGCLHMLQLNQASSSGDQSMPCLPGATQFETPTTKVVSFPRSDITKLHIHVEGHKATKSGVFSSSGVTCCLGCDSLVCCAGMCTMLRCSGVQSVQQLQRVRDKESKCSAHNFLVWTCSPRK